MNYTLSYKSKLGEKMDQTLDTWIEGVMKKQQYRSGIDLSFGFISFMRKLVFGSTIRAE